jgi:hypothetical protein
MKRAITTLTFGLVLAGASLMGNGVAHADGFRGDHDAVALESDEDAAGYGSGMGVHMIDVEEHIANDTCATRASGVTNQRLIDDDMQVTRESASEAAYVIFLEEFHFCPDML